MVSAAGKIIQQHTDSVISGKIAIPQGPCPRCSEQTQTFIRHERRVMLPRFYGCSVIAVFPVRSFTTFSLVVLLTCSTSYQLY